VIRRPLFAIAIAGLLVVAMAAPAVAHVTARADNPTPGGFTKITFRVPNEEDTADTTQLQIQLPTDNPIASVSVKPKQGWTYQVTTMPLNPPVQTDDGEVTQAVSQITWTGGAIKPGEFDEFEISGGPLPTGVDTLTFKALQTYSDGTIVRWIDEATEGGAEPAHPAPTISLVASDGAADDQAAAPATTGDDGDSDTAKTLGIVGIILGALGLIAGVAALGLRAKPADGADSGAGAATGGGHGGPAH
jgi:uncharacterized protein YcnI